MWVVRQIGVLGLVLAILGGIWGQIAMGESEIKGARVERAMFAGGCFWCLEPAFDLIDGVVSTVVGYTGGKKPNPTYEDVILGKDGYVEAIEVTFDPSKVSFERLLKEYWENVDPTQSDGQFADRGPQYQTAIFYSSLEQRKAAEESKISLEKSGVFSKPIVVKILPASTFYPAEDEHQDYYRKHPGHYSLYKEGSGRGPFIRKMWKK